MDAFGIAIFCDDIREEVGGKVSLIGCYGTDLQFTGMSFPVGVPKLAIYVVARLPIEQQLPQLQLRVYFPGDADEAPTTKIDLTPQTSWEEEPVGPLVADLEKARLLRFPIVIAPALLKEQGFVRVRLKYGPQLVRLGALRIHSVASAPPPAA